MNDGEVSVGTRPVEDESLFEKQQNIPKLQVGLQIFLELAQKSKTVRAKASILGWSSPTHLMISFPTADNKLLLTPFKSEVVVRYLLDGVVYGFTTKVIDKQQKPLPMWILIYPAAVETKSLRRSPRVSIKLPVTYDEDGAAFTIDLSANGALLSVSEKMALGQSLRLSFQLPDGTTVNNLFADVVRLQESRENSMVGVNFRLEDPEKISKISQYLYEMK